jgi:hypothetical protein
VLPASLELLQDSNCKWEANGVAHDFFENQHAHH